MKPYYFTKPYTEESQRESIEIGRHIGSAVGNIKFPITARVVDGILQNFVYGTFEEYPDLRVDPNTRGDIIHLEVSGEILSKGWKQGTRRGVQNILNLGAYAGNFSHSQNKEKLQEAA